MRKFLSLNESFWILNKQTNKIDMKNKLIAVIATLGMVASASAVKVNNNLSINGFIDGSYVSQENDTNIADQQSLSVAGTVALVVPRLRSDIW